MASGSSRLVFIMSMKRGLSIVALMCAAIFPAGSCSSQVEGITAQKNDAESLEAALRQLSRWWVGKTHVGEKTWFDDEGNGTADETWTVSVAAGGNWLRQLRTFTSNIAGEKLFHLMERVEFSGQRIIAQDQRFGLPEPLRFRVNGSFTGSNDRRLLPEFHPDLIWAGYSNTDGMYFSDLLKLPGCVLLVSGDRFDGEPAKRFSFDLKGHGEYEFVVSGTPPLIRSAEVRKNRVYEIYVRDFFDNGETAPVNRKGDGLRQVVHRIDYTEVDGQWIPEHLDVEYFYTEKGVANSPHWKLQIDISDVKPFHIEDTTRAVFTELPVKNGTPIEVKEKAGLAYEFRDGRIARVVEHSSVAEMDGIRFRKPESSGLNFYLWGGVTAALVLIGALIWHRRSSGD